MDWLQVLVYRFINNQHIFFLSLSYKQVCIRYLEIFGELVRKLFHMILLHRHMLVIFTLLSQVTHMLFLMIYFILKPFLLFLKHYRISWFGHMFLHVITKLFLALLHNLVDKLTWRKVSRNYYLKHPFSVNIL